MAETHKHPDTDAEARELAHQDAVGSEPASESGVIVGDADRGAARHEEREGREPPQDVAEEVSSDEAGAQARGTLRRVEPGPVAAGALVRPPAGSDGAVSGGEEGRSHP